MHDQGESPIFPSVETKRRYYLERKKKCDAVKRSEITMQGNNLCRVSPSPRRGFHSRQCQVYPAEPPSETRLVFFILNFFSLFLLTIQSSDIPNAFSTVVFPPSGQAVRLSALTDATATCPRVIPSSLDDVKLPPGG